METCMKLVRIVLAIALVAACAALGVHLAGCNKQAIQAVTISLLKQIPRTWLVLQTDEDLTVANIDGGGLLLGPRVGMATAVRRTHWGCELSDVSPGDIVVFGREVRIKLPDPVVFDTMVDMASFRFLTRRSGFQALADAICGRNLMRELAEIACRTPPEFCPEQIQARRTEFVRRLNEQAAGIFQAKDLTVRFE